MGAGILNRYGVVSDEISDDPELAFPVARELGMVAVDLNSVWDRQVTDLDDAAVRRLRGLLDAFGLRPFMVAGLPFKTLPVAGLTPEALVASPAFADHMRILERSLEIASALGAPCARVHAFAWPPAVPGGPAGTPGRRPGGGEIPDDVLPTIAAGLRAACARAKAHGCFLGLENVRASYGNTGRNLRTVVGAVADPALRIVWDPANAFVAGEERPFPDGYAAVQPFVSHVHCKDARLVDLASGKTAWACIGDGAVDWPGQLRALAADGYEGLLCVETHWTPAGGTGEQATRTAYASLRRIRDGVVGA